MSNKFIQMIFKGGFI